MTNRAQWLLQTHYHSMLLAKTLIDMDDVDLKITTWAYDGTLYADISFDNTTMVTINFKRKQFYTFTPELDTAFVTTYVDTDELEDDVFYFYDTLKPYFKANGFTPVASYNAVL